MALTKRKHNQPVCESPMPTRDPTGTEAEHRFGGDWTEAKLRVLGDYLAAYTTALKNQPFKKGFIDAFAGTGYRTARLGEAEDDTGPLLFPDLADEEPQQLLDGSARIALRTEPPFDSFVFIEKRGERCRKLEELKSDFTERAQDISILQQEANRAVRDLCGKNWTKHRAVLFLDPYGMQVEWQTLEAVARTKAIDLWLLFPLGIGVNRLLTKDGACCAIQGTVLSTSCASLRPTKEERRPLSGLQSTS